MRRGKDMDGEILLVENHTNMHVFFINKSMIMFDKVAVYLTSKSKPQANLLIKSSFEAYFGLG